MKKILVTAIAVLCLIFLQLLYINYRLEQRINNISKEQKLTGAELQKLETQVFMSSVKLVDYKIRRMEQKSEKPVMLIALND